MIREVINYYRKLKHRGKSIVFLHGSSIDGNCIFEGYNSIGIKSRLQNCQLGLGTYTGRQVELASIKIGRFCSLGSYIRNSGGRHPLKDFVSTHPAFFSKGKAAGFTFGTEQKFEEIRYADYPNLVTIGNDVWIGDNVSILDGVKIGDGAVIGANSLVTKDISPYTINVGTPAKTVDTRFDEVAIKFLLEFKWWNKDFSWIRSNYHSFSDIKKFRDQFKNS